MKINIFILLLVAGVVIAADLGNLNRSSDVVTGSELTAYATNVGSLEDQIDANALVYEDGVTTNYVVVATDTLVISNGVIVGIQ